MGGLFICARSRIATYDKKYYTEKKQTEGVDMYIADLHIHSRFSRATSRDGDAPHLDWWARRKGIAVLGTGDFTHPAWRAELKEQLVPAGDGVYTLREDLRLPGTAPARPPGLSLRGRSAPSTSAAVRRARSTMSFCCPVWRRRTSSQRGWKPWATSAPTAGPFWAWTAGICWN